MAKKKGKKQTWVVTARWKALSKEQKVEEVRAAMAQQGASNTSVATELGCTPGMVSGIRFKNKIPSTNEPRGAAAKKVAAKPVIVPSLPKPRKEARRKPDLPPLKMAASEATQCHHRDGDDYRCGGEREPDSEYCARHQ